MAGGKGGGDREGGSSLRRWLNRVDRSVDDEVNRFFAPDEKSRTGEAVDKYYHQVEESLQKATVAAKKKKTDLDAIGDDYIARLFGGGRKKRERSDEANIGWITRRPKTIILALLLVVMVASFPAVNIVGVPALGVESQMRGDFEVFLPPNDEVTLILNEVREDWSTDAMFIYGEMVSKENVTDVAILKALSTIEGDDDHKPPPPVGEGFQEDFDYMSYGIDPWRDDDGLNDGVAAILSIPMLIKVVNQTISEMAVRLGVGDIVGNYSIPSDQNLIDRLIGQLPPDILGSMVADTNDDDVYDKFALIVLLHRDPKIQQKVMANTQEILDEVNGDWETQMVLYLTGPTPLIEAMQRRTIEEFFNVIWLVIVALMVALWMFHRTIKVIPIALIPVTLGLGMSLGIVGALHEYVVITPQVVIIAPVLLALGVSYGLYISNRYAEEKEGTPEKRIARAVRAINPAIMLSALTTGIGFASLMIGTLPPIFTMGFALTMGILFTYILTYTMVPALIVLMDYKKKREAKGMKSFSTFPSRNRKKIVLFTLIAVVLSITLIPQVRLDADYLQMAPKDEPAVIKMEEYSRYMGGGQLGMFIIRWDPYEADTLDVMDQMGVQVNEVPNTQGISVVDVMKSISLPEEIVIDGNPIPIPPAAQQSLWAAIKTFSSMGPVGQQIADRLIDMFYDVLAYEPREMLISSESRRALVYIFQPFLDIGDTRTAVDGVNGVVAQFNDATGDPQMASRLTGVAAITLTVNDLIIVSQYNSLTVCIFLTFLVLTIIFRSIKIGFMTIIPVLCVISLEPGTLVALDIPLSTITVMIGSIAIGTGVDFSIQISQRLRLGRYKMPAVFNAVEKAGTSFVEATSTMLLGFAMVLFIRIDSIQEFVIMLMILLAYNAIFALVLLPAIFTIWIRRKDAREAKMQSRPPTGKRTGRDRYENVVRRLFRIRDTPEVGGSQSVLPFDDESPR